MRNLRICLLILGVLLLTAVANAQVPTSLPKVTILGSEMRSIHSPETGRDYDLYIHLPSDYAKETGKKYPVVYIMDGQWDFKLMDSVLGGLVYDKFVPDMVLVGITYAGENPDFNALRAMDLTPVAAPEPKGSGDAPKFYAFLKNEVIPYVEGNYRVDAKHRVLMGSSFGGLFTLYAMFRDPSLFSGYMAASPAVSFGDRALFKQEVEFAKANKGLPVKLYVGVGSDEGLTNPVKDFMKTFESRKYAGLTHEFKVFDPERHASNKPELYNRGLRYLFEKQ